jgi:hypothetical protein
MFGGISGAYRPSSNDLSLGFSDGYIISDDDEFDAASFFRVKGGVLFFGQAEVEDVSCVVPVQLG